MPKSQLQKLRIGLAGEHYVSGQLMLRGYIASMTLKNYPKVDLFVHNPRTNQQTAIQVKSIFGGKMYYVPEKIDEMNTPFVFVYFTKKRGEEIPEDVEYYIVPSKVVAKISHEIRETYISDRPHVKKEQPRMIGREHLKTYKDKWENIGI